MQTKRRRLTKSEWVILLSPFLLTAFFWLVTRGRETWVRRYMPTTLQLTANVPGQKVHRVESLMFSPDGRYLAVGQLSQDYSVSLWDCQTKQELWKDNFRAMTYSPQFSPDGKQIGIANLRASLYDPETSKPGPAVQIYDVLSGQMQHQLPLGKDGGNFSYLPDGKHLLTDGVPLRVWDIKKGQVTKVLNWRNLPNYSCVPKGVSGQVIRILEGRQVRRQINSMNLKIWESTAIKIYDLVAGKTVATLPLSQNSDALFAKEADSLWIIQRKGLLIGPGTMDVFLWNWRTGKRTAMNTIPHKPIQVLSPNGKTFISVELEWDFAGKIQKIIGYHIVCDETQTGKTLWRVRAQGPVRTLHSFPDGGHIVSSEGENQTNKMPYATSDVVIRNAQTGATVRSFKADGICKLSPDGRRLAIANGETVQIYDVSDLAS